MIHIIFVLGPTNSGKTTVLETAGTVGRVHLVEVGKMMRAKYLDPGSLNYNPDYFKGDSSPAHTAIEAFDMMQTGIARGIQAGKDIIFVDGQPRDIKQCDNIFELYERNPNNRVTYLNLYAPLELRRERAAKRDSDPVKLALSMARMEKDVIKIYEVLCRIMSRGSDIVTVESSRFESYHTLVDFLRTHMDIRDGITTRK